MGGRGGSSGFGNNQIASMKYDEFKLNFEGTEKQIKWAQDILDSAMNIVKHAAENIEREANRYLSLSNNNETGKIIVRKYNKQKQMIEMADSALKSVFELMGNKASFYIDRRDSILATTNKLIDIARKGRHGTLTVLSSHEDIEEAYKKMKSTTAKYAKK